MGKEAVVKEKQEDSPISDLYQKLEDMRMKHVFLTSSIMNEMIKRDLTDHEDNILSGFQMLMYSFENEFKEVNTMFDTLFGRQRLLESAEAGISISEQGAWATREAAIQGINEDISRVKSFIEHNNKLKEKAEHLLKRGEKVLLRYQTA